MFFHLRFQGFPPWYTGRNYQSFLSVHSISLSGFRATRRFAWKDVLSSQMITECSRCRRLFSPGRSHVAYSWSRFHTSFSSFLVEDSAVPLLPFSGPPQWTYRCRKCGVQALHGPYCLQTGAVLEVSKMLVTWYSTSRNHTVQYFLSLKAALFHDFDVLPHQKGGQRQANDE